MSPDFYSGNLLGHIEYLGGYIVRLEREPGLTKEGIMERPFYFQTGPLEEVRFSQSAEHTDYNVLAGRQLSRPAAKGLLRVQFRAIFVDYVPAWASYDHLEFPDNGPLHWVTRLRSILRSLSPVHVSMGNPWLYGRWEVDMPMTMRETEAVEQAGEPDARYVDLQLTEFDEAELDVQEKGRRRAANADVQIVTVYASGRVEPYMLAFPTLAQIAQRVYGSTMKWTVIAKANDITGWTANRDLTEFVKKVRGRDFVKLKCPPAGSGGGGGTPARKGPGGVLIG